MQDSRETVLKIAAAQKRLLGALALSVLINLTFYSCRPSLADYGMNSLATELGFLVIALAIVVFQIVCIVRLGLLLNETAAAVVCAIGQFAPCVNLALILWLNSRATARLQKSGIRVDMLANAKDLENYHPHEFQVFCPSCNTPSSSDFDFCPKCGARLVTQAEQPERDA